MQRVIKFFVSTGIALSLIVAIPLASLLAQSCKPIDGRELKDQLEQAVMSYDQPKVGELFDQYYTQDCISGDKSLEKEQPKSPPSCKPIDGRELKDQLEQAVMSYDQPKVGELFDQYYAGQCQLH